MLQVVDAERDGFLEAHRAEVSGHFEAPFVRLSDGRAQLGAADVSVRLYPRCPLRGPVRDEAPGRFGGAQHGHAAAALGPGDIGRSEMDARPWGEPAVDLVLEVDLGARRPTPGGADGRHSRAQRKPWLGG